MNLIALYLKIHSPTSKYFFYIFLSHVHWCPTFSCLNKHYFHCQEKKKGYFIFLHEMYSSMNLIKLVWYMLFDIWVALRCNITLVTLLQESWFIFDHAVDIINLQLKWHLTDWLWMWRLLMSKPCISPAAHKSHRLHAIWQLWSNVLSNTLCFFDSNVIVRCQELGVVKIQVNDHSMNLS